MRFTILLLVVLSSVFCSQNIQDFTPNDWANEEISQSLSLHPEISQQQLHTSHHNKLNRTVLSVEDEDEDGLLSRKSLIQIYYFVLLTVALISIALLSNRPRLPISRHLAFSNRYKYIFHRVLII